MNLSIICHTPDKQDTKKENRNFIFLEQNIHIYFSLKNFKSKPAEIQCSISFKESQ